MEMINDVRTGTDEGDAAQRMEMEAATGAAPRYRRLHSREDLMMLLELNEEQVLLLISTRQITRIRIGGEERFDSWDIDRLIEAYKATAERRAH